MPWYMRSGILAPNGHTAVGLRRPGTEYRSYVRRRGVLAAYGLRAFDAPKTDRTACIFTKGVALVRPGVSAGQHGDLLYDESGLPK